MRTFFVFDIESIGLHGQGYAAGFVVISEDGTEVDSGRFACDPERCGSFWGDEDDRIWVKANIPPIAITHKNANEVRQELWKKWREWADKGAIMAADCPWPVEARFLILSIENNGCKWDGPYPFIDIASVVLAKGGDPLATFDRLPSEMPKHDPLADARQSARILLEHLHIQR